MTTFMNAIFAFLFGLAMLAPLSTASAAPKENGLGNTGSFSRETISDLSARKKHHRRYYQKRWRMAAPQDMGATTPEERLAAASGGGVQSTRSATKNAVRASQQASQGDSMVISGVSPACRPWYRVSCGCEISLKVFGRIVNSPNLKQARTWGAVFPHTSPSIGMVVGRSHHVALIIGGSHGQWQLFDPNSGGQKTRTRVSDLREFRWVVNPHGISVAGLN